MWVYIPHPPFYYKIMETKLNIKQIRNLLPNIPTLFSYTGKGYVPNLLEFNNYCESKNVDEKEVINLVKYITNRNKTSTKINFNLLASVVLFHYWGIKYEKLSPGDGIINNMLKTTNNDYIEISNIINSIFKINKDTNFGFLIKLVTEMFNIVYDDDFGSIEDQLNDVESLNKWFAENNIDENNFKQNFGVEFNPFVDNIFEI